MSIERLVRCGKLYTYLRLYTYLQLKLPPAPGSDDIFDDIFDDMEEINCTCDGTLRYTQEFAEAEGPFFGELSQWLEQHGASSDCKALIHTHLLLYNALEAAEHLL
jgi:hypothetical protein